MKIISLLHTHASLENGNMFIKIRRDLFYPKGKEEEEEEEGKACPDCTRNNIDAYNKRILKKLFSFHSRGVMRRNEREEATAAVGSIFD
jgi:uncharacterized protein YxeA